MLLLGKMCTDTRDLDLVFSIGAGLWDIYSGAWTVERK